MQYKKVKVVNYKVMQCKRSKLKTTKSHIMSKVKIENVMESGNVRISWSCNASSQNCKIQESCNVRGQYCK